MRKLELSYEKWSLQDPQESNQRGSPPIRGPTQVMYTFRSGIYCIQFLKYGDVVTRDDSQRPL